MAWEQVNRKQIKREVRERLRSARVSPMGALILYMVMVRGLYLLRELLGVTETAYRFTGIAVTLAGVVLSTGFTLYCMTVLRGERAGYSTLLGGFAFAGKVILLFAAELFFVLAWGILLIIPGIIAMYRYSFAFYNLCENPGIGVLEALEMSKRQTAGCKSQLFMLDLSYIGWHILAILTVPVRVLLAVCLFTQDSPYLYLLNSYRFEAVMGPAWLWLILFDVWRLLVSLFYVPHMRCVWLTYFAFAKRASGVGEGEGGL